MRTLLTPRFFEQALEYAFRFTCPECVHYTGAACAHEWPNEEHVRPPEPGAGELSTCKEFELV